MIKRIIYAPKRPPYLFADQPGVRHYPVVFDTGEHIRDGVIITRTEEYWRAYMVTGMTNQRDPFFTDRSTLRYYGRRT